MWAALAGRLETIKLLLEKGADPNRSRDPKITTLSLAREFGLSCAGLKEPLWYQDEQENRRNSRLPRSILKTERSDVV